MEVQETKSMSSPCLTQPELRFETFIKGLTPIASYNCLDDSITIRMPTDWTYSYLDGDFIRKFSSKNLIIRTLTQSETILHIINHETMHWVLDHHIGYNASVDYDHRTEPRSVSDLVIGL